jgi:uncharacterized protein YecE (DUF72 family)
VAKTRSSGTHPKYGAAPGILPRTPAKAAAGALHIGTSGWSYKHWHGPFYPPKLPTHQELAYASRVFSSLEINRSFYSLLTPQACRTWADTVPEGFVFALKGSGFITHRKQLKNVETALANFFASGPLALARKLGPIVWQLPASRVFDEERFATFFALLPRTLSAACELASRHDEKVKRGSCIEVSHDAPIRHVLEARHESFFAPRSLALLEQHNIALAISDSPDWPSHDLQTADFMYLRLHGSTHLYTSSYRDDELETWAVRIRGWSRARSRKPGSDVYVYFDNDVAGRAVEDALKLKTLLGQPSLMPIRVDTEAPAPSRGIPRGGQRA